MAVDDRGFRIVAREAFPSWNPICSWQLPGRSRVRPSPPSKAGREENEKERVSANLKQVGMGLATYHQLNGHFPPAAILGKDGRPLLSWRVELLPHLGLGELYEEFHRDERFLG